MTDDFTPGAFARLRSAGFIGAARRLSDIDIPRIGAKIGVGEDEIHALIETETSGSGFDGRGRPKMLFEPHVLYRNLTGPARDRAVAAGLAYPKWGERPYPADSYPRLIAAMAIDETAALKAASWGLGQVLGENVAAAGYGSPQEMVVAFAAGEEAHVEAMVAFLRASGLADDLRAHRWSKVAAGYNGPGYAKNSYDLKLAASYAKWSKIADTPWQPPAAPLPTSTSRPLLRLGSHGDAVVALQVALNQLGYGLLTDGDFGSRTMLAVQSVQTRAALPADGVVGPATWAALASVTGK